MAWGPCLLAAAASYAVILRPQQNCMRQLEAKVAKGREEYARALQAAKDNDQKRLMQEVEVLHERVEDFVVPKEEAPNLAFTIGTLANGARLESFGMRPVNRTGVDAPPRWERVGEKRLALSFAASFRGFAAFLNTLERHRPILLVETFAINRPVEKGAQPQADMELAVLVEKAAGPAGGSQ